MAAEKGEYAEPLLRDTEVGVIPVVAARHCADNPAFAIVQPLHQVAFASLPRADTDLSGPGDQISFAAHADQGGTRWMVMGLGVTSRRVLSDKTNESISSELPAEVAMTGSAVVLQGQVAVHCVREQIAGIDVSPRFRSYREFVGGFEVIGVSLIAVVELKWIVENEFSAAKHRHDRRRVGSGQ